MRLPGKTRQFPFLAVATLSVAAVGVSAPAWVPNALASAGPVTTTSAPLPQQKPQSPQRPAANSATVGYVLSGDGTRYRTYDSADRRHGAVTVTPIGTSVFKVDFAKLGMIARAAAARATAFNPADSCVLDTPRQVGSDLEVIVQCIRVATGNADLEAEFELVVTKPAR